MISFVDLTLANWPRYRSAIMDAEKAFPASISFEEDQYIEALGLPNIVARVAVLDKICIGVALGCPLTAQEIEEDDLVDFKANEKVLYMYNLVISPSYQCKGHGRLLFSDFVDNAEQKGFTGIVGHFRKNASLALMKKFGGVERKAFPDWSESGEEYVFCELSLKPFPIAIAQMPQVAIAARY